jgi:membrane carboxypeptidase/penicillin-binding protein
MPNEIRGTPLRPFTFRNALIRIHNDLFAVDRKAVWIVPDDPLTNLERMVLILEDRRFFFHMGIDLRSCVREVIRFVLLQKFGGASTIDMQFVRTATGFRQKKLRRKLYEMLLAYLIQFRFNKMQILRSYLKCAFFGSHLFGSEAIAQAEYQKLPDNLTLQEAAEVAAMLVYPRPSNPTAEWRAKVSRRANYAMRLYPRLEQTFKKLPRWKMSQVGLV